MKTRIHIAPNYFFNPTHPITISLIGVGGSGSLFSSRLARLDYALREIGHPGLHVKAFDADIVEPMNIGRQLFTPSDVGEKKVHCSLTKINHAFGLQWEGLPKNARYVGEDVHSNIVISCVDNAKFRFELSKTMQRPPSGRDYQNMYYWLDLGNSRNTGQYILGSCFKENRNLDNKEIEPVQKLKNIIDLFPNIQEHDTPSIQGLGCSYEDKLKEQSLFINDVLVAHASDCLSKLLVFKQIKVHGGFVNLDNGMVNSIKV